MSTRLTMLVSTKPGLTQFWLESTPMTNLPYCSAASKAPSPELPAAAKITSAPLPIWASESSFPLPGLFHADSVTPT